MVISIHLIPLFANPGHIMLMTLYCNRIIFWPFLQVPNIWFYCGSSKAFSQRRICWTTFVYWGITNLIATKPMACVPWPLRSMGQRILFSKGDHVCRFALPDQLSSSSPAEGERQWWSLLGNLEIGESYIFYKKDKQVILKSMEKITHQQLFPLWANNNQACPSEAATCWKRSEPDLFLTWAQWPQFLMRTHYLKFQVWSILSISNCLQVSNLL